MLETPTDLGSTQDQGVDPAIRLARGDIDRRDGSRVLPRLNPGNLATLKSREDIVRHRLEDFVVAHGFVIARHGEGSRKINHPFLLDTPTHSC